MMETTALKSIDPAYTYGTYQTAGGGTNTSSSAAGTPNIPVKTVGNTNNADKSLTTDKQNKNDQKLTKENLDSLTNALNKFMQSINANIRFKLHDGTKEMIVQVVDESTHQVLKEFPPHQLLDTMAAIRERIGILLDERV